MLEALQLLLNGGLLYAVYSIISVIAKVVVAHMLLKNNVPNKKAEAIAKMMSH